LVRPRTACQICFSGLLEQLAYLSTANSPISGAAVQAGRNREEIIDEWIMFSKVSAVYLLSPRRAVSV
jgi:hypothetical protein